MFNSSESVCSLYGNVSTLHNYLPYCMSNAMCSDSFRCSPSFRFRLRFSIFIAKAIIFHCLYQFHFPWLKTRYCQYMLCMCMQWSVLCVLLGYLAHNHCWYREEGRGRGRRAARWVGEQRYRKNMDLWGVSVTNL